MKLSDQARPPEFDYEPVVVVYRALPNQEGQPPVLEAVHVSRMPVCLVPKTFTWNSRAWPRSTEFYPFDPNQAGRLNSQVSSQLLPSPQYPDWLVKAAEQDDALRSLLTKPRSNKHLQNRFLLTGRVSAFKVQRNPDYPHRDLLPLELRQGEHDQPIELGAFRGSPDFKHLVRLISKTENRWKAITALGKAVKKWDFDGEKVLNVRHRLLLVESLTVDQHDIQT